MLRRLSGMLVAFVALCCALAAVSDVAAQEAAVRLRVVLVLDASGSMAGNDPKKLVRVASKMLSDLADERDHVTVMSFGSTVKTLASARGSDHSALRSAIETLGRSESCTDYAQALEAAAGVFSGAAPAGERRVVLFLTDGRFEPVDARGSCSGFDQARDEDRQAIIARVDAANTRFAAAGARVFTIGLGAAPARAEHSAALLTRVASATGGRFLKAGEPRDVPRIFAQIFGALVGAPVMQQTIDRGRASLDFTIPKGADGVHVVLVPDRPADLDRVTLEHDGKGVPFETAQIEAGTSSSYRLARIGRDAPGSYRLAGKDTGHIEVLVIPDVGLSLRIERVPALLPEGEKVAGVVALRTRAGDPVQLTGDFLSQVVFTVELDDAALFDQRPAADGVASFASPTPLRRGKYRLRARAKHQLGFLDVPAVEQALAVEPRFPMTVEGDRVAFDTMAEEGPIPLSGPVRVRLVAPESLPSEVTLSLALPEDMARDIVVEPTSFRFAEGQRSVELELRFADPEALRGASKHYTGNIRITPDAAAERLIVGDKAWAMVVDGKLRPWTWARYFEEYKWHLAIALCVLLLVVWIIGRAVAQKFPDKARIYHVEVGQDFESDALIKRYASHGAYRSARFPFPLGKKARPLVFFKSTGAGFEVLPAKGTTVTIVDDAVPEGEREKTKPFAGRWDQRYRLADRFEVYLARQQREERPPDAGKSSWA